MRSQKKIIRQWRLLSQLNGLRSGARIAELVEQLGASRATVYRDLMELQSAGFPLYSDVLEGQARWILSGHDLPPLAPTPRQLTALQLARASLARLEGSTLVDSLDAMLSDHSHADSPPVSAKWVAPVAAGENLRALETAIGLGHAVRFEYRDSQGQQGVRHVEPLRLHVDERQPGQVYAFSWDLDREAFRTFKLARVADVRDAGPSALHPEHQSSDLLPSAAVAVWSGETVDVEVHVRADVAHLLPEWPLHETQQVEPMTDGWHAVRASVAGLPETMRWVLRWGRNARVSRPPELRAAVRSELEAALSNYRDPPSHTVETGSG